MTTDIVEACNFGIRVTEFINESNQIEGIYRDSTREEYGLYLNFLALETITVPDLQNAVNIFQPGAKLRDQHGMNVRVGVDIPPAGGPGIRTSLVTILENLKINKVFPSHVAFENLHPFTDGNGRVGRLIWLWQVSQEDTAISFLSKRSFLQEYYYRTLRMSSYQIKQFKDGNAITE